MLNIVSLCKSQLRLIILAVLVAVLTLGGFPNSQLDAMALGYSSSTDCDYVEDIEGEYLCEGQCVLKEESVLKFLGVSGETDTVEFLNLYPRGVDTYGGYYQDDPSDYENMGEFYKVTIEAYPEGEPEFHEVEIGPFNGTTLQTATTEVSDSLFPVVELYSFDAYSSQGCQAQGFTKIVSNPTEENFKSCVIQCDKVGNLYY